MSQLKYLMIHGFLLALLLNARGQPKDLSPDGSVQDQTPAQVIPDFSFIGPGKVPFTNKDLPRDKPLFFLFVDPDCEHCQQAMRAIGQHFSAFRKAAMYVVSLESREKISLFIDNYGRPLKGQKNVVLLQDNLNQFIVRFKPRRYPAMLLYSPEGKLLDYEDNAESVFRFFKPLGMSKG